jgi:hypothetical protein
MTAGKSLVALLLRLLSVEALLLQLALHFVPLIVAPAERLPLGDQL